MAATGSVCAVQIVFDGAYKNPLGPLHINPIFALPLPVNLLNLRYP